MAQKRAWQIKIPVGSWGKQEHLPKDKKAGVVVPRKVLPTDQDESMCKLLEG